MNESMNHVAKSFVVFEGYDGSGKSSLIDALRSVSGRSVRVIGRKLEPELVDIARILEREDKRPNPSVEMLLRIAVEAEREQIISQSLASNDLIICDRGFASLVSWFDYLDVDREPYNTVLDSLLACHRRSVTIACTADFDTCWERSSSRPDAKKSRKDRLGKDVNRRYFDQYEANVRRYADSGSNVVFVDTMRSNIPQSTALIVQALEKHGLLEPMADVGRIE
ncbi:AAA family ATPase [Nocardia brasiliensis]|uniref:AAA family ATPase n=1 Tax=Nocardia brasiliensis TaxID=37326 RepID=UPI002455C5D4|nr:AAA family ATPase [Nocardia brasiliensis]